MQALAWSPSVPKNHVSRASMLTLTLPSLFFHMEWPTLPTHLPCSEKDLNWCKFALFKTIKNAQFSACFSSFNFYFFTMWIKWWTFVICVKCFKDLFGDYRTCPLSVLHFNRRYKRQNRLTKQFFLLSCSSSGPAVLHVLDASVLQKPVNYPGHAGQWVLRTNVRKSCCSTSLCSSGEPCSTL